MAAATLHGRIRERLLAVAAATKPSLGVFPLQLPAGTALPAITYQRISGDHVTGHSGSHGLGSARYQFSCWADDYNTSRELAEVVRLAFQGYRSPVAGEWQIQAGNIVSDAELIDPETGRYHSAVDALLWFTEAVPT